MIRCRDLAQVYRDLVPCCSDLRNPALLPRHWDKIDALVGRHIERDPEHVPPPPPPSQLKSA